MKNLSKHLTFKDVSALLSLLLSFIALGFSIATFMDLKGMNRTSISTHTSISDQEYDQGFEEYYSRQQKYIKAINQLYDCSTHRTER